MLSLPDDVTLPRGASQATVSGPVLPKLSPAASWQSLWSPSFCFARALLPDCLLEAALRPVLWPVAIQSGRFGWCF